MHVPRHLHHASSASAASASARSRIRRRDRRQCRSRSRSRCRSASASAVVLGRALTRDHDPAPRRGHRLRAADDRRTPRRAPPGRAPRTTRSTSSPIALNGVLVRIERGVAAQRQFAADASHELRTPLTVISTNLEVARRKPRDPAHWEHVADDTLAEVHRMTLLVDKLLVLSRAGAAGLAHARPTSATLVASVGRAPAERSPRARHHDRRSRRARRVRRDRRGRDRDRRRQPAPQRDRSLADRRPVTVAVGPGPRITVEDRGPGIPADQRERGSSSRSRAASTPTPTARPAPASASASRSASASSTATAARSPSRSDPGGGARFVVDLPAT